ncbi:cobalt ECF transporter T component CbiQ [Pelolinea submarina]|uniref:Cobalt/nickel transport system permease protein n=1 Tax=Pelolinea submarina TaxID=913107 RepID=A0A347ZWV7_9CHLR|nr:cobalt ECF transporter T component CbiQ [Pelolinea submarina]REG05531.1 cobalt/nickel transport system permease protein [Pelolinea submarina]BBB49788.1 cobalt/nickel transport system permease protein [Pelolinea submarina]
MPVDIEQRASYEYGDSLLHLCDARIKITLLMVYLITTALLPVGAWAVYLLMGGVLLIVAVLSEIPASLLLKRALLLEVPILLVLIPQIFLKTGNFIEINPWSGFAFSLSLTRLERVASLLVRSWLSLQFAVIIMSATRFEDVLAGLRACGLPRMLTAIFGLMWRYLYVLLDEMHNLTQARRARSSTLQGSFKQAGGSVWWRAQVTGGMAGMLMLRSLDRSQRIYQAMQARGYDGEIRSEAAAIPLTKAQYFSIAAFILAGLLMVLLANGMAA